MSVEDRNNPVVKEQINTFTVDLHRVLGDRARGIELDDDADDIPVFEAYKDEESEQKPTPIEVDELDYDEYHKFIKARVIIPVAGEMRQGTVIRQKRDDDGKLIGRANKNPLLDTNL